MNFGNAQLFMYKDGFKTKKVIKYLLSIDFVKTNITS